jgi:hypothetical protein
MPLAPAKDNFEREIRVRARMRFPASPTPESDSAAIAERLA